MSDVVKLIDYENLDRYAGGVKSRCLMPKLLGPKSFLARNVSYVIGYPHETQDPSCL
jgi:hypothetical protein